MQIGGLNETMLACSKVLALSIRQEGQKKKRTENLGHDKATPVGIWSAYLPNTVYNGAAAQICWVLITSHCKLCTVAATPTDMQSLSQYFNSVPWAIITSFAHIVTQHLTYLLYATVRLNLRFATVSVTSREFQNCFAHPCLRKESGEVSNVSVV